MSFSRGTAQISLDYGLRAPCFEGYIADVVRCRTSSQKPGDEFIANFRQTFPEVATSSAGTNPGDTSLGDAVVGAPHPDRYVDLLARNS